MSKRAYSFGENHYFSTGKTPASVIRQRNEMNFNSATATTGNDNSDIAVCVVAGIAAVTAIGVGIAALIDNSGIAVCVVAGIAAVTAMVVGIAAFVDNCGN